MKSIRIITDKGFLCEADVADTFFSRFMGLMGKSPIERALWITPCGDIHTFFMKEPIDVVFVSDTGKVVRVIPAMPKNKVSGVVKGAVAVLELPANTLQKRGMMDIINITTGSEDAHERQT